MTVPRRWPLLIVAVLALVAAGCDKTTPPAPPTTGGSTQTPTPPPPAAAGKAADYCTLAERIGTQSGVMVNKHFIPLRTETLDMFKAIVNLTLAVKDQLAASVPDDIRPAFAVEMQYFQALKDANFASNVPPPAGFIEANKAVNDYGVAHCGFVFDE
jgi:hypothetical protein